MTLEMVLRRCVAAHMAPYWVKTWHEDREVNPGVPDLSYVMKGDNNYETGWLELKAEPFVEVPNARKAASVTFRVEPSQHQWIAAHHPLVPVHFLCMLGTHCYLVPGAHHILISNKLTTDQLRALSIANFDKDDTSKILPGELRRLSRRDR